ncbi:MAG: NAD(P)/FAD-dependent oxidoreductase [Herpetosiphon sp.]
MPRGGRSRSSIQGNLAAEKPSGGSAERGERDGMTVVVVGAGLAGLTCARRLADAGRSVHILESSDGIGGRVRSDHLDGFTLDRGFQVLFDAYPAVQRNIDLEALDLRFFDPGALICRAGRRSALTDPIRDRNVADLVSAAITPEVGLPDKLSILKLLATLVWTNRDPHAYSDLSTEQFLQQTGFSSQMIDRFFRPFFGGVFLERQLQTTAAAFVFYFQMLSRGHTALPASGMEAIPRQLAAPLLERNAIRFNAPVAALTRDGDRATGLRLESGEEVPADIVVLAVPAPAARHIAGVNTPAGVRQTTEIYFAGTRPVYSGKKIMLNANANAVVNNAQQLSAVVPEYAPAGQHLLAVSILGQPDGNDQALADAAIHDLRRMWAGDDSAQRALDTYRMLRMYHISYAQFDQPPGIYHRLPGHRPPPTADLPHQGLFFAAEWTDASSINGAMASGERCAALILNQEEATE